MAALKSFIAAATITFVIQSAMATNFTVGAPGGSWDLSTNLGSWASAQTFAVGDNLIFSYSTSQHDVLEVSKADYDSCGTGSPIKSYTTGNDIIPLPAATARYFVCGTPGHCKGGMKVAINVVAAGTPSPQGSSPPPPPPPSPTSTPPPPPPPKKSGADGRSLEAKAAVGLVFGMLVLLAL